MISIQNLNVNNEVHKFIVVLPENLTQENMSEIKFIPFEAYVANLRESLEAIKQSSDPNLLGLAQILEVSLAIANNS